MREINKQKILKIIKTHSKIAKTKMNKKVITITHRHRYIDINY